MVQFEKLATLYPGTAPLHQILAKEAAGAYLNQDEPEDLVWDAKTVVERENHLGDQKPIKDRDLEIGFFGKGEKL